jgi:hypothetical protein
LKEKIMTITAIVALAVVIGMRLYFGVLATKALNGLKPAEKARLQGFETYAHE